MQQILVDLRCLNYPKITGVNAYTIRLLHCLFLIQSKTPDLHFSFYALQSERVQFLCSKFPFLADLFSSGTMLDLWYCEVGFSVPPNPLTGGDLPNNSPKVESNNSEVIQTSQKLLLNSERSANSKKSQLFNFHNPKFYEVRTLLHAYFFGLNSDRVPAFDLVILPQPRTLLTNSNSRVLTVFHDIFYLKEKSRSWRSKMIYNVNLTHKIFNQSARIFANSFSTATDLTDFFGVSNKVKLVYPALPKLDELHGGLTYNSDLEFAKKSLCPSDISLYQGRTGEDLSPNFVRQNKTHSKYILAISGIEPRKNWLNLIHAINYLKTTKGLKIPLVLAGTIEIGRAHV